MNRPHRKFLVPAFALVFVGFVVVPEAVAQRTIFSGEGWDVSAPDQISCSGLPELKADGGRGSILDSRNQAALTAMLAAAAPILRAQCPSLGEVIVASGSSRRIMALPPAGAARPTPAPSNAGVRPAPAPPVTTRRGSPANPRVAVPVRSTPEAPRPTIAGSVRRLPGIYDGTITCNQSLTGLRVTIDVDVDGLVSAEWASFAPNGNPNRPTNRSSLSGRYDAETGRLRIDRAASGFRNPRWALDAVFDSTGDTISGEVLGRDCGPVLLRASQDKAKDTRKMREEAGKRFDAWSRGPRAVDDGDNDYERCYAMVRWAVQLGEEYPNASRIRLQDATAVNLFMDSNFVPVFGKPYDELSGRQRNGLYNRFQECRREDRIPDSLEWTRTFVDGFRRLGNTFDRLSSQIAFRRQARTQWNADLGRLAALPATEASYDEALRIDAAHVETREILWPSEVKRFEDAVASARSRSAESVLIGLVDGILENATGLEALDTLLDPEKALRDSVQPPVVDDSRLRQARTGAERRAAAQQIDRQIADRTVARESREQLLGIVSPEVRSREVGRLTARAREIATVVATERAGELESLGQGLEALESGTQWVRSFNSDLRGRRNLRDLPMVDEAYTRFLARRGEDRIASEPLMQDLLFDADSSREINGIMSRYLGAPDDRQSPVRSRLNFLASGRSGLLDWAGRTACNTIPEAFKMEIGHVDGIRDDPESVTLEDVTWITRMDACVAVNDLFEEMNANFRSTKSECETGNLNPILAMKCLVQFGATGGSGDIDVRLSRFEFDTCTSLKNGNSACKLRFGFQTSGGFMDMLNPFGEFAEWRWYSFSRGPEGWLYLGPARLSDGGGGR